MRKFMIALAVGTVIGLVPMFTEQAEAQRLGRGPGMGRVGIGGGIGRAGFGGGIGRVALVRVSLALVGAAAVGLGAGVRAWAAPLGGAAIRAGEFGARLGGAHRSPSGSA